MPNFKSKAAYKKWLAFGHASGEFAKTPGHQKVSIKGKKHKVKHETGGDLRYNFGLAPAPAMTGNTGVPAGQIAGSALQGIGGIVSMVPGWGTAVGMGLAGLGSIVSATSAPKMTTPVNYNMNPYGYATGGDLTKIANGAYQVQGHSPSKTDGVDMGPYRLDDKEVVVGTGVFSNTLKNPVTNNSFAQDALVVQKALGKYQNIKKKIKDYEFQDEKHLKKDTKMLFDMQERLASALGLRNPDGTPVQDGKNGYKWGGKKPGYQFGVYPEPLQWMNELWDPSVGSPNPGSRYTVNQTDSVTDAPVYDTVNKTAQYYSNNYNPFYSMGVATNTPPTYKGEFTLPTDKTQTIQPYNIDNVLPPSGPAWNNTGLDLPGFGLNQTPQSFDPERPVGFTMPNLPAYKSIPEMGPPYNLATDINASTRNIVNQPSPTLGQPLPTMVGMSSPAGSGPTTPNKQGVGNAMDNDYIKKLMKDLHPYGEQAGLIGAGVSVASILANRPFYVNYGDVGRPEIAQQNKALRRVVEGEKSALQDATDASRSAMAELENRSLQSRNANLRNIVAGEIDAKNKIRGQFAGMEANARMQVGQRRTAIQQANLQKNMYQDDINTREYDTMQTENMKSLMNFRNLALEKQNVMNQVRRDEILKSLLQSPNFKWDGESIKFISSVLQGDSEVPMMFEDVASNPYQAYQRLQPKKSKRTTKLGG